MFLIQKSISKQSLLTLLSVRMLVLILYAFSGQKWKTHRKLIAPTFHLNVLKSFVDLFNANSRAVCEKMAKENGKPFDCHDYMSECTVEILLGKSKSLFHWFFVVSRDTSKRHEILASAKPSCE